jgi:hypothetical protein
MYTWQVHRRTCEACRVLEAEVDNDREGKVKRRGIRYAVAQSPDTPAEFLIGGGELG